ncbi:hypothetical protein EDD86DRAFT_244116 [Gorgonomyces haynaldii]|nr:hypothetical protein EDD86DRAFT_244116 [Gorgonomyces haynaldii]
MLRDDKERISTTLQPPEPLFKSVTSKSQNPSARQPRKLVIPSVNPKRDTRHNINAILHSKQLRVNPHLTLMLESHEFDQFLRYAIDYMRGDLPNIDKLDSIECSRESKRLMELFSKSYCYLLLLNSRKARSPAKERSCFEAFYTLCVDTCKHILEQYKLPFVIEYEFQRLFRSKLFQPDTRQQITDPVDLTTFNYITSEKKKTESQMGLLARQSFSRPSTNGTPRMAWSPFKSERGSESAKSVVQVQTQRVYSV